MSVPSDLPLAALAPLVTPPAGLLAPDTAPAPRLASPSVDPPLGLSTPSDPTLAPPPSSQAVPVLQTPVSPANAKRRYPSNSKGPYGWIEGVGEGNEGAQMARTRELEEVFTEQKAATRHYRDKAKDVITRCESIATRSSCWLYVAMQHPSSTSNFYHFASRKLRMEAPDELNEIHKQVGRMMSTMKRAGKLQNIDFCRQQQQAEEQVKMAQIQVQEADERATVAELEADRLRKEVEAQRRLVAQLRMK
ncbi:hypothetical protein MD484_g8837, partial [Candolleomyces efflorescens]